MIRKRKARRLPPPREDVVQALVIRHLGIYGVPGAVWCHVPNGGSRHRIEAARMKRQGVTPGMPDLLIFHAGRTYGLELKREIGGRLSVSQKDMHARLTAAGVSVATAYGLDEALTQLAMWGLIRTTTARQPAAA